MIKFFRSIRQRLLSENKFSKYLIYAIGEIVLVVIGILIALRINNWNESKKNSKLVARIMEAMLAYTDKLTGLASRAYFYKHTEDIIRAARRRHERFALLYLDLDGFKDINDSLGHDMGDELLRTVSQRLQSSLRDTDFIARLSGDEFCILVDNVRDQYDAAEVAERCLDETNRPVWLGKQQVRARCSIGIAYYPEDGTDLQSLLKAADSAMYAAKEEGRHRYAFYRPELTQRVERRLQIEQELRLAIERDELILHYQPQVELSSGRLAGVEALVRWKHPDMGLIPPGEFIAVA